MIRFIRTIIFLFLVTFINCGYAFVPHRVEQYGFSIELPDGYTKLVVQENPSQRIYESWHGNHTDTSFVHIMIQKQDIEEDWDEQKIKKQIVLVTEKYKEKGSNVLEIGILQLRGQKKGLLIHSRQDGKEHVSMQAYFNGTMYIVSTTFDEGSTGKINVFLKMLKSIECLNY